MNPPMDIYTVRTFSNAIDRSEQFVRRGIELRKIKAERIGNRWMVHGREALRFQEKPFKISRKEMGK